MIKTKFKIEITSILNSRKMTKQDLETYLNIVLPQNYYFNIIPIVEKEDTK